MGFNPTDDGFILAGSRRILEGQIPHLDFISIRPIGSYLLHVPFVFFGGDYTFWISRYFVWFQFACIAWLWTIIIDRLLETRFTSVERILYAVVAFGLSSHNFAILAWHSVDALFLSSIALALCVRCSQHVKMMGYLLIGLAPLCRQNFLLMIPVSIILVSDWRKIRYWLIAIMPGLFVGIYLLVIGAFPDALLQMGSQTDIMNFGVKIYIRKWSVPLGILLGYWAMYLSFGKIKLAPLVKRISIQRLLGGLFLFGVPLGAAIALSQDRYIGIPCFGLFGTAAGATMYFIMELQERFRRARAGILVLVTAWSVSISVGYNTPALGAGFLTIFIIACSRISYQSTDIKSWMKKLPILLTTVLVIVTLFSYGIARQEYIYRDLPAHDLTHSLDGVFPGGSLIRTNPNTHAFLADLQLAIDRIQGLDFCILPDLAGYWVKSPRTNPLSIDWVQGTELNTQPLVNRVIRDLKIHRGNIIVIVQKVLASSLPNGFIPLPDDDYYRVVQYVRMNFMKIEETEFFDLYK